MAANRQEAKLRELSFSLDLLGGLMEEAIERIDAIDDLITSEGAANVDPLTKVAATAALAKDARVVLAGGIQECERLLGRKLQTMAEVISAAESQRAEQ